MFFFQSDALDENAFRKLQSRNNNNNNNNRSQDRKYGTCSLLGLTQRKGRSVCLLSLFTVFLVVWVRCMLREG